ncbi:MAG: hypothetical protein M3P93_11175 [Actinomycetota bacterium]|jgi:hypothetical protein|nr:hypothetical protein [Actinomycetota bacterium]
MSLHVLSPRGRVPRDRCEHCDVLVHRVWLVPGDVLNSCAACYRSMTGSAPVHDLGHSTEVPRARHDGAPGTAAAFYLRVDGRRPA